MDALFIALEAHTRDAAMKKTIVRLSLLVAIAGALAMTGCNTVKGVGRDIEAVGEKTQKAIND